LSKKPKTIFSCKTDHAYDGLEEESKMQKKKGKILFKGAPRMWGVDGGKRREGSENIRERSRTEKRKKND